MGHQSTGKHVAGLKIDPVLGGSNDAGAHSWMKKGVFEG
jgi:hypothetical protein